MLLTGDIINITNDVSNYILTNKNNKNTKNLKNAHMISNISNISNIVDKSQITITISSSADIYYSSSINTNTTNTNDNANANTNDNANANTNDNAKDNTNDSILTIIILNKMNSKGKQKENILEEEEKTIIIPYGICSKYLLLNRYISQSLLSKKVKKNNLTNIYQNIYQYNSENVDENGSRVLYKFNDCIFITLDANGYINYYPDSIEIYDIHTITNFIEKEHSNSNKTYLPYLEAFLETFNYIPIDTNMKPNSYILDILDINNLHNTNTNNNNNNNTNTSNSNSNDNSIIELNESGIISKIGNIINWFNPFSYFSTTQLITLQNIDTEAKQNPNPNPKYYVSSMTKDLKVIKLEKDKIKVLRPKPMLFPVYIDNINMDELNNIIFSGKINDIDNNISIKYNKFLINPIIEII
jgi:hypothetical protein